MVRIGFYASAIGWDFDALRQAWVEADRLGFDSAHIMDNEVAPEPWMPEKPVFECFTVLPALAEATRNIHFGPLVTPCGRRSPALFAKMTSVLDVLSNGRLILAMGIGNEDRHFVPWGQAYPEKNSVRAEILREEIEIIKRMWVEEHATFEGAHYTISDAVNSPKPVQRPHPPLWLGFTGSRRLLPRLAAQYADGINLYVHDDDEAVATLRRVQEYCAEFGRSFEDMAVSRHIHVTFAEKPIDFEAMMERQARAPLLGRSVDYIRNRYQSKVRHVIGTPDQVAQQLIQLVGLGFNHPIVQFMGPEDPLGGSPGTTLEFMKVFAREVMPVVRDSVAAKEIPYAAV